MQKIVIVLSMLILASCGPAPQPQPVVVEVDVSPIKTAEVTIVQDKTTKHELLSVLGAPTALTTQFMMTWHPSANVREYFDVRYIQRDGTTFEFCVGIRKTCKNLISVVFKVDRYGNSLDIVNYMDYH